MCGIGGFIGGGTPFELEKVLAGISHRGGDDSGVFFDGNVGLTHSRLSILDLSPAGHQPMFSQDEQLVVVFNGEVYNFEELRRELIREGCVFKSSSDTEVLLFLYRKYDEDLFSRIVGMFAIALYDRTQKKLILARDRAGEKPLYWALHNNRLVFASELGALIASNLVPKKIDKDSLAEYLVLDYVPTPSTILASVYKLEPATTLVYKDGKVEKKVYWHPPEGIIDIHETEAVARLDDLLLQSVTSELIADVPLGVFLSGGIDSSTIAWYAQKKAQEKINTFSIGFHEPSFDESAYARQVAMSLGTNHHMHIVDSQEALSVMDELPALFSEPVADASIIPTFLLSKFAGRSVKVILGGDGGDELFAGYPTFLAEKIFQVYQGMPQSLQSIATFCATRIPLSDAYMSLGFRAKKFVTATSGNPERRHAAWLGSFTEQEAARILGGKTSKDSTLLDRYARKEFTQEDAGNRLLYFYFRSYLLDEVLVKVDRASMHIPLEVRAPFLDHRIIDFVFSLPYEMKFGRWHGKKILKKLMRGRLPKEILERKKKGFAIPLSSWLKKELYDLCHQVLSRTEIDKQGLFSADEVERLMDDHFSGRVDNSKKIWNLMTFSMWYRKWLDH